MIKKYKPTTNSQRFKTTIKNDDISNAKPYKPLVGGEKRSSGRNNQGTITIRRRGGGHKKKYRTIDFKRAKLEIPAKVESIEYDPNRTAFIALVCYLDGERRYVIAPDGLKVGESIISSNSNVEVRPGNSALLKNIPIGTNVHNIEMQIGKGGAIARSSGSFATISGVDGDYIIIKLPSGESRKIHGQCRATIGIVSNSERELLSLGKAGRSRWLGKRPKVRGVAMNPVDHPLGGGEGRSSGGRHPVSPWGKLTKGKKTRNKRKVSERFILSRSKK